MRLFLMVFCVLLFCSAVTLGQTKVITGKVLDQDLFKMPGVAIYNANNVALGITDTTGSFRVQLPIDEDTLVFRGVGFERTPVQLSDSCRQGDVILMYESTYDFMSFNKINRIRKRLFKKLPVLYAEAYKEHLFTVPKPCYERSFVPWFPLKSKTD